VSDRYDADPPDCLGCGTCDDCILATAAHRVEALEEEYAAIQRRCDELAYYLRIYHHAHETGNNVPPHMCARVKELIEP
jgi:hypothetical protein